MREDKALTEDEKQSLKELLHDYNSCIDLIYQGSSFASKIDYSVFDENQQNNLVASAMSMGFSDAITKLESSKNFDEARIDLIKDLTLKNLDFNFSHGGLSARQVKKIQKENEKSFEEAKTSLDKQL